jgi:hypothetical protein
MSGNDYHTTRLTGEGGNVQGLHDRARDMHGGMSPQQAQNLQNAGEQLGYRIGSLFIAALKFSFSGPMSYFWFCMFGVGLTMAPFQLTGIASIEDPEVPEWVFALIMALGLAWSVPLAWYLRSHIPRVMPWVLGAMLVMAVLSMCVPAH